MASNVKEIIAIGGGKGGTGKSFLSSNIGAYLAKAGHKVILIDADLGGANLHSFLNTVTTKNTLSDFIDNRITLKEAVYPTMIENLNMIVGDVNSINSSTIKYSQKLKLYRHIMNLDADYILLDLGAGSHYNTIDSFLIADKMVVVVTPEKISIENMYHFIKNSLVRNIEKIYSFHGKKHEFTKIFKERESLGIKNIKELIEYLILNTSTGDRLAADIRDFKLCVVVNKIKSSKNIQIGYSIQSILDKYLGIKTYYIGFVEHDDHITQCVNDKQLLIHDFPALRPSKEVGQLSENLINNCQIKIRF